MYEYCVNFIYRENSYSCKFFSTAKITPDTDPKVAWDIAEDAIKERMKTIANRVDGIYPYSIVLYSKFGTLMIKE